MVVVVADQDHHLTVLLADQVVVEVDQVVVVERKQQLQLIQVPLNMDKLVDLLEIMVVVAVVLEPLDNHIHQPMKQDGVVQEYKHQQHSEILMQDMVGVSLEEIHQDKIGDSLVVAVAVAKLIPQVLMVVLMFQVVQEEHQVDHTMVQEVVH
tara:strand:+ start:1194 stop:1649 length:456 start_codon:yes stop_codon:yes gene_type:complete